MCPRSRKGFADGANKKPDRKDIKGRFLRMPRRLKDLMKRHHILSTIIRWFDSEAALKAYPEGEDERVDWVRILPFIFLHAACFAVIWVAWSWVALGVAAGLYVVRMFAITAFYHRYFSHRTYKTHRIWQFLFAVLGNAAVQRGPLWWAAHHRHHHRYADKPEDIHSPVQKGFIYSHVLWLTTRKHFSTQKRYVSDWMAYPELRWLNRHDTAVPFLLVLFLFALGHVLSVYEPSLGTSGFQMVIWGFFISTVVLFHATATINSLDHMFGTRRYRTPDNSRNNPLLALITLGEGWHNNHHHYSVCARQGFYWWELDITYYVLVLMSYLGIVRDLRPLPEGARETDRV